MDITTMVIITTINHHKMTIQTCSRTPLSGHEKAMLSYNRQHGFFISVLGHIYLPLLFRRRPLPLTHTKNHEYISDCPIRNRGRRYLFGLDSVYSHFHIVGILGLLWLPIDFPEKCSGSIS